MSNIRLQINSDYTYSVYFYNGSFIGKFVPEVDGFYYFVPIKSERSGDGEWSQELLRDLYNNLAAVNNEWNEQIQISLNPHIDWQVQENYGFSSIDELETIDVRDVVMDVTDAVEFETDIPSDKEILNIERAIALIKYLKLHNKDNT